MTRTRPTRASWSAAAVVSPIVAAMAAGSLLWAASNNPLATADAAPATTSAAVVQSVSGPVETSVPTDQLSLAQLRKKAERLSKAAKAARKEARAAREAGVVSAAGGSTWVPSTPASNGSGGGAAAQPAPAPAPAPAADTWTGSSGG
jgi:hypothetical protein